MEYPKNWNQPFKKIGTIILVVLFIVGVGYWIVKEVSKPQPGEYIVSLGNKHIENITDGHEQYNSLPPHIRFTCWR